MPCVVSTANCAVLGVSVGRLKGNPSTNRAEAGSDHVTGCGASTERKPISDVERGRGHLYLRGTIWWAQYFAGGGRFRCSTGTRDKEEARALLDERIQQSGTRSALEHVNAFRSRLPKMGYGSGRCLVGAAAEMLICADLMSRGFHLYRALGQHSPYDLIAAKDDLLIRVESKSADREVHVIKRKQHLFDVLATVTPSGIIYRPHPAEWAQLFGGRVPAEESLAVSL